MVDFFFFKEYDFKIEFPTYENPQDTLLVEKKLRGWNCIFCLKSSSRRNVFMYVYVETLEKYRKKLRIIFTH